MSCFIRKSLTFFAAIAVLCSQLNATEQSYINGIESHPLILSNHDLENNSLQNSVYELLERAEASILLISFTFDDPEVIRILNKKAASGVDIHVVIDRDHIGKLFYTLHDFIEISDRPFGEGHLHHKILVVDHQYTWIGSANFSSHSFTRTNNLALAFYSPEIAEGLHQESQDIAFAQLRSATTPLTATYGDQLLELYILPHNDPYRPHEHETFMNSIGQQTIIDLINGAEHHIKIYMDVWTYKDAARAIIDAKARGVKIDIAVSNTDSDAIRLLDRNEIWAQKYFNAHYKFMIIDDKILVNGSPNWSMNAFSRNDESFTVLYDLTDEQLEILNGPLSSVGLPLSM